MPPPIILHSAEDFITHLNSIALNQCPEHLVESSIKLSPVANKESEAVRKENVDRYVRKHGQGAGSVTVSDRKSASASLSVNGLLDNIDHLPREILLSLGSVSSVALNRMQIRSRFVDLFYTSDTRGPFSVLMGLIDCLEATKTAVMTATDAICVLQLGAAFQDTRLLLYYHELYGQALRQLYLELSLPNAHKQSKVLGAAKLLALSEYINSTTQDESGWMSHCRALCCLIQARGPGKACAAGWSFRNWRLILSYGLTARQNVFDRRFAARAARDGIDPLTLIALRVPGALQRLDNLLECSKSPWNIEVTDAVQAALSLREELQSWILEWSFSMESVPYQTVSLDRFPAFQAMCGDLQDVFPEAHIFPGLRAAGVHRILWVCLLLLSETVLRLQKSRIHLDLSSCTDVQPSVLEDECASNARHLCQSIAYFNSPEFNSLGPFSVQEPLHFALQYYERQSAPKQVAWCIQVREHLVIGAKVARVLKQAATKPLSELY